MGKRRKNKKSDGTGGWSDDGDFGANPFASALAGMDREPAAPAPADDEATGDDDAPSTPNRAVVRHERKGRGGKSVTVISHLELDSDGLESWCADLRKSLGCGGGVEGDTIVLQGDQRERAADALEARGISRVSRS